MGMLQQLLRTKGVLPHQLMRDQRQLAGHTYPQTFAIHPCIRKPPSVQIGFAILHSLLTINSCYDRTISVHLRSHGLWLFGAYSSAPSERAQVSSMFPRNMERVWRVFLETFHCVRRPDYSSDMGSLRSDKS